MKRESGNAPGGVSGNGGENMRPVFIDMLKTLLMLEHSYGPRYLTRILKGGGTGEVRWRKGSHTQLETFGCLQQVSDFQVQRYFHLLMDLGWVMIADADFGTLTITRQGIDWLDAPSDVYYRKKQLFCSKWEYSLLTKLRDMRKSMAAAENVKPFQICTDFLLERLAHRRPQDLEQLRAVEGFTEKLVEKMGESVVFRVLQHRDEVYAHMDKLQNERVTRPTYDQTRELMEEGLSLTEIATRKGMTETGVCQQLVDLYECGLVELRDWVENTVDGKTLYRVTEFFRKLPGAYLREAFMSLSIDYNTLRLCRIYAGLHVRRNQTQPKVA